jgi:hypothetical protein
MSAVRNGGTPARSPIAAVNGARSATVETAPGPTEDRAHAIAKKISGITCALPRAARTPRLASASRLPFVSASENSSVTPVSVMNSEIGKPLITASGRSPAT